MNASAPPFETSLTNLFVLAFEVDPARLSSLLPPPFQPSLRRDRAFVSVEVSQHEAPDQQRGSSAPPSLRSLLVYYAPVFLKRSDGTVLEGRYPLRADVNDPRVGFYGHSLRRFRFPSYQTGTIRLFERGNEVLLTVETEDKRGDLVVHLEALPPGKDLPTHPGFEEHAQEGGALSSTTLTFAWDKPQGDVIVLPCEREELVFRRLSLLDHFSAFFSESPFTASQATPAFLLGLSPSRYRWGSAARISPEEWVAP